MVSQEVTIPASALSITLCVAFVLGVGCGYQLKTWRLEWLKRRRDRLQRKIEETQSQIQALQKGH